VVVVELPPLPLVTLVTVVLDELPPLPPDVVVVVLLLLLPPLVLGADVATSEGRPPEPEFGGAVVVWKSHHG